MAVRPTAVFLGDLSMAGQRPVGELTAIDPSYDDPQPAVQIWNQQASAWQVLTPGVNTNPSTPATSFWGVESAMAKDLTAVGKPIERVIKHAKDSHISLVGSYPSWSYNTVATELVTLLDLIRDAALAAPGDNLRIDAFVISIQCRDFLGPAAPSYAAGLRRLIGLLTDPNNYSWGVTLGSVRGDGGKTPVVLVEPHYEYTGLDHVQKKALLTCRMLIQSLACEADRIAVARSEQLTSTNGLTLSAISIIDLSRRCSAALLAPVLPVDENVPEARLSLFLGDSILDGTSPNSALPAHQQAALAGAMIWSPYSRSFVTLQAGANNQNSLPTTENGVPPGSFQLHGPEIAVMDSLRAGGEVFLVKGAVSNTFAAANDQVMALALPPTLNRYLHTWSPAARQQMWDLTINGWFLSAVRSLRRSSRKPKIEMVVISCGTNDLIFNATTPLAIPQAVQEMIASLNRLMVAENLDTSAMRVIVCVPSLGLAKVSGVDLMALDTVRTALLALPGVAIVDLSDFSSSDYIHPDAPGTKAFADRLIALFRGELRRAVSPLFVPSMSELRRSLRLSAIDSSSDALAMIDSAVETASVTFFRHIGGSKIETLRSAPYTRNPLSALEYLRVLAVSTEIKIVRAQLLRSMPTLFMDGAVVERAWQQEAAFREGSTLMHRDELKRLDEEIRQALATLQSAQFSSGGDLATSVISPESSIVPGQTISSTVF